jgi:hypothetical protein
MSLAAEIAKEFSPDLLPAILAQLSEAEQQELETLLLAERCDQIEAQCSSDPLYWLRNHTLTENEQYILEGLEFRAQFPAKSYLDVVFDYFQRSKRLFIPKSRDMMTSWSAAAWGAHQAQWHKATVVVQTESEDKAKKLVKYARILWNNQDEDLKRRHPLKVDSTLHLEWADGGEYFGIPCGETKIRIHHPTIYIMDEAAFLPGAKGLYEAAYPVAGQIIAISSAGPGWFGDQCDEGAA